MTAGGFFKKKQSTTFCYGTVWYICNINGKFILMNLLYVICYRLFTGIYKLRLINKTQSANFTVRRQLKEPFLLPDLLGILCFIY